MPNHYCVRVYPNGEAKHTVRDEAGLESWLDYNRRFRGNALFVDGKLAGPGDHGGLDRDLIEHVESVLTDELSRNLWDLRRKDTLGAQIESFGGFGRRYQGYRPEASREQFRRPSPEASVKP